MYRGIFSPHHSSRLEQKPKEEAMERSEKKIRWSCTCKKSTSLHCRASKWHKCSCRQQKARCCKGKEGRHYCTCQVSWQECKATEHECVCRWGLEVCRATAHPCICKTYEGCLVKSSRDHECICARRGPFECRLTPTSAGHDCSCGVDGKPTFSICRAKGNHACRCERGESKICLAKKHLCVDGLFLGECTCGFQCKSKANAIVVPVRMMLDNHLRSQSTINKVLSYVYGR